MKRLTSFPDTTFSFFCPSDYDLNSLKLADCKEEQGKVFARNGGLQTDEG
jgi:hypothetical protein